MQLFLSWMFCKCRRDTLYNEVHQPLEYSINLLNNLQQHEWEIMPRNGNLCDDSVLMEIVQKNKHEDSHTILIEMN